MWLFRRRIHLNPEPNVFDALRSLDVHWRISCAEDLPALSHSRQLMIKLGQLIPCRILPSGAALPSYHIVVASWRTTYVTSSPTTSVSCCFSWVNRLHYEAQYKFKLSEFQIYLNDPRTALVESDRFLPNIKQMSSSRFTPFITHLRKGTITHLRCTHSNNQLPAVLMNSPASLAYLHVEGAALVLPAIAKSPVPHRNVRSLAKFSFAFSSGVCNSVAIVPYLIYFYRLTLSSEL